jgi:hypothetical protein
VSRDILSRFTEWDYSGETLFRYILSYHQNVYLLLLKHKDKVVSVFNSAISHEDMWENGRTAPSILNVSTGLR